MQCSAWSIAWWFRAFYHCRANKAVFSQMMFFLIGLFYQPQNVSEWKQNTFKRRREIFPATSNQILVRIRFRENSFIIDNKALSEWKCTWLHRTWRGECGKLYTHIHLHTYTSTLTPPYCKYILINACKYFSYNITYLTRCHQCVLYIKGESQWFQPECVQPRQIGWNVNRK